MEYKFPSPDGELVGLDVSMVIDVPHSSYVLMFPSPDGELVGLDNYKN